MVYADDIGEYTITATNQFGFISGSVMLMSEGKKQTENHYLLCSNRDELSFIWFAVCLLLCKSIFIILGDYYKYQ